MNHPSFPQHVEGQLSDHLKHLSADLKPRPYPVRNPPCSQGARHREILVSPYDIEAALGIKAQITVQREGTLLVIGPRSYHGVVNIGVTMNLSSNISTPFEDIVFPYRCDCGVQEEVERDLGEDGCSAKRAKMLRLAANWKDGAKEFLESGAWSF